MRMNRLGGVARLWMAAIAVLLSLHQTVAAESSLVPAEYFFREPFVQALKLSPSGDHLAAAVPTEGGRVQLAVMGLSPLSQFKVIAGIEGSDVGDIYWVNDRRVVFSSVDLNRGGGDQYRGPGLYAVDLDGSNFRQLIHRVDNTVSAATQITSRILTWHWMLYDMIEDGSPDVVVGQRRWDSREDLASVTLYRLNTVTGEKRLLTGSAPAGGIYWVVDEDGEPRVEVVRREGRRLIYWRRRGSETWEQIGDFKLYVGEGFQPVHVDDKGTLYAYASQRERDLKALYRFDAEKRQLEAEPSISLKGFDLDALLYTEKGRLLGLRYRAEQLGTYWLDKKLAAIQASVDQAMPEGRTNLLHCGRCSSSRFFVIESQSGTQPGEYYLLDNQQHSLKRIAARRPWIDEKTQGARSFHWAKARDGLMLPVVVTRPATSALGEKLPTVVLVHGGPYLRGTSLEWSGEAQFLASRGYLVVEPDFRGSTGYGFRHFAAGFKQWGLAMQDDIEDSLKWAIDKGWADGKRACIAGASYGGYAALMGVIRHPGSYRCAVSISGVADIQLMYSIHWSDLGDSWQHYGMPELIGDPQTDADQLVATSPLQQAAKIKVPVFLAHGVQDLRVPIDHERKFRAAAEKAGVAVEWVEYTDEAHGGWLDKNWTDVWLRAERFLARHLRAD